MVVVITYCRANGSTTGTASSRFAENLRPVSQVQSEYRKHIEIWLNSKDRWMLSLQEQVDGSSAPVLLIKGAPDVLLSRCSFIQDSKDDIHALDKNSLEQLLAIQRQWSGKAAVIARQCHIITNDGVDLIANIRAKALEHAPGVLADTRGEKPEFKDSASQVQSNDGVTSLVLSGSELVGLQAEHWNIICGHSEIVFARTMPEQKLLIIQELCARKNYVAVMGDGVNDSPALKAAHIGVGMGGGSEVAKEAADMVLLDNNFLSIVVAIENGRLVFENLKKVFLYLLPAGSFAEFVPMLLNMSLGASISLMYESPESDIMLRAPRNPKKEHLVNFKFFGQAYGFIGFMEALFTHIIFFVYMYWHGGFTPSERFLAFDKWTPGGFGGKDQATFNALLSTSQSVYFLSLVIIQWGNMFATCTQRLSMFQQNPLWGPTWNPRLLFAIPFTLGVVSLFCYIDWFNRVFATANIPVAFFFIPIPFVLIIIVW
ncbi:hypothetical protein GGI17_005273 [Coemansia sp. S146]|nr:hypothetical protein GGI17_005273 [Coemansia sp. S146]